MTSPPIPDPMTTTSACSTRTCCAGIDVRGPRLLRGRLQRVGCGRRLLDRLLRRSCSWRGPCGVDDGGGTQSAVASAPAQPLLPLPFPQRGDHRRPAGDHHPRRGSGGGRRGSRLPGPRRALVDTAPWSRARSPTSRCSRGSRRRPPPWSRPRRSPTCRPGRCWRAGATWQRGCSSSSTAPWWWSAARLHVDMGRERLLRRALAARRRCPTRRPGPRHRRLAAARHRAGTFDRLLATEPAFARALLKELAARLVRERTRRN